MSNLYLIETEYLEIINNKVDAILKDNNLSRDNLITYDMENTNITDAIIDLNTYSLFGDKKVVLCKNSFFLTAIKGEIEHNIEYLEKYLNNPNPNNILILSCQKLDNKKNIVKLVKEKCKLVDTEINLKEFIKNKCKGYKIDNVTIDYLISNTLEDINNISNELDKLLALTSDTKEIKKSDIDLVVIKKIDNNIFELIDAIISKNKKKSFEIYNNMINYGEDVFKIFVSLSNQIRLIYQVKALKKLSNDEITKILNLKNSKQVAAIRYKIDKYTSGELLDYLHKLSIMDEQLKTGKCIDTIVFPVFIANI